MVTIAVTGANGFIGAYVCDRLKADGHHVVPITRADYGDLAEFTQWGDVLQNIDCVIHLAARVHQTNAHQAKDVNAFQRDNVIATQHVLNACEQYNVKRFVFLSTIAVMGYESTDRPFQIDDKPAPFNPYSQSKADAEAMIQRSTLDWQIIRIPLVYGPGVRANFLSLAQCIQKGVPLPFGHVRNARSIVYIDNLTDALAHVATKQTPSQRILHIADAQSVSTKDMMLHMAQAIDKKPRIFGFPISLIYGFATITNNTILYAKLFKNLEMETSRTNAMIMWQPPYNSQEGLHHTMRSLFI